MTFDTKAIKPAKIKAETLKTSLTQPVTLYPALVGFLGGAATMLFGMGGATLGALVGGAVLALGGWSWEYFARGGAHANRYIERYRKVLEAQRKQAIAHLDTELSKLNADDAIQQLQLFQKKFEIFNQVLNRKLQSTELTYNRYLAMAEQVYLNGLDNLEGVSLSLQSISAIDRVAIEGKLQRLDGVVSAEAERTREQLRGRLQLFDEQMQRVRSLYAENEEALTKLDQVSARLANTDFSSGRAAMDMEQAIKELTTLIENSQQYAQKK
ncbi:hypothetical protein O5O45_00960 [Hahella aquimaris]|uniref:hypothetical protein n=1 Tax=Hahella sp. HNIBRBA332 TaxID=3015983 RepID=UPI00273BCEFD|nr:hypothetical protein [Hahella sp. HNIBRBA332]WLQ14506.1 hypothetical protein O5O45_00960 [Hahella sp. HNIBRBA332]